MSNETHQYEQTLAGYGLVIYDNWCKELQKESDNGLETLECIYPHIFIHYESKLRIKQFLELCIHIVDGMDVVAAEKAISKYAEILDMCEKAIPGLITEKPKSAWDAKGKRQGFIRVLQRSRELEVEALNSWALAVKAIGDV